MKNWSNFYTPLKIANKIIKLIPADFSPEYIVDICAGSGNFLDAAISRWDVEAIGIDLDPKITQKKDYIILKKDTLDLNNLTALKQYKKKLILANPPFGKLEPLDIVKCSKHTDLHIEAIKSNRMETSMIVSNMSLIRKGDIFAAILPENIFSSENLKNFRSLFLSHYDVIYLGSPEKYFTGSEVRTRIFIGKYISPKKIPLGLKSEKKIDTSLNFKLIRGIDNSKLLKNINDFDNRLHTKVVHFSNNSSSIKLVRYTTKSEDLCSKIIQTNDLLISRVGRNTGKIHQVRDEFIGSYMSDYFYLLKDGRFLLNKNIDLLEKRLISRTVGLTVKYLKKGDILEELEGFRMKN